MVHKNTSGALNSISYHHSQRNRFPWFIANVRKSSLFDVLGLHSDIDSSNIKYMTRSTFFLKALYSSRNGITKSKGGHSCQHPSTSYWPTSKERHEGKLSCNQLEYIDHSLGIFLSSRWTLIPQLLNSTMTSNTAVINKVTHILSWKINDKELIQ